MKLDPDAPHVLTSVRLDHGPDPAQVFTRLSERVVGYLSRRTPISSWSVNRVEHGTQVHLHVDGGLIDVGHTLDWDDSICRRVLEEGAGPVIPDLSQDSYLRGTHWAEEFGSYAGRPIVDADGELFGMLCGLDTHTLGPDDQLDVELVDLFCSLLSAQATLARVATAQAEEDLAATAGADPHTGLLSRTAWDELLAGAHTRAQAFGDLAAVVAIAAAPPAPLDVPALQRASSGVADGSLTGEGMTYLGDGTFLALLDDASPSTLAASVRSHRDALTARGFEPVLGWTLISPADESPEVVLSRALASLEDERRPPLPRPQ